MKRFIIPILVLLSLQGCSLIKTIVNVSRLKYKLENINNFKVNGISITNKSKLSDFGATDVLKLTTLLTTGKMPVSFTLNVAAKNPNDGSGGYPATDITIKDFPWELYLNGKKTISGNISSPLTVPGVGETKTIPLIIEFDMVEFFGKGGLSDVMNIAFQLGGKSGSTSNVQLIAQPTLGTPIGDLQYPDPVKIIDQAFN